MDRPSLIIIVMPIVIPIALFTGIALPFIAASRPGRSHARGQSARADADAVRRISAARRGARPPKPGADDAAPVEYLYVPCARIRYNGYPAETRRWVQEVPIVKKTAKWIYYTSDTWDRSQAVVSPGRISREEFETGPQCHENCLRDIAAGLVCAPHGRGHRHCVHFLAPGRHCYAPGGCGEDCPAGTLGVRCAKHGYTWDHCPHVDDLCRHRYPAGVIPIPGDRPRPGPAGRLFFATREAAEADLYRGERERAEQAAREAPPIKELRRAMADAHPDRGGTAEQFIQAPPVPDGASDRATVTCSPHRPRQTRRRFARDCNFKDVTPETGETPVTDVTTSHDQDGPELSAADEQLLRELTERARTGGLKLTGEGGLLGKLTKMVVEAPLEGELEDHLGYGKDDPAGRDGGNSRNGHRVKTVITDTGPVEITVPRDRESSFEPKIVAKRQRRLTGVDEMVISPSAKG